MQRINQIDQNAASEKTASLLAAVKRQMGGVPNIISTMAQSPAALAGYLNFSGALAEGNFSPKEREQIALAIAGANECDYCASAHTVVGGMVGLGKDELSLNVEGRSTDGRTEAALRFARQIVAKRGLVANEDIDAVRRAGFTEGDIIELIALTSLNIFTNYLNHVAETEIDFPVVRTSARAAA